MLNICIYLALLLSEIIEKHLSQHSKAPTSCFSVSQHVLAPSLSTGLSADSLQVHRNMLLKHQKTDNFHPSALVSASEG